MIRGSVVDRPRKECATLFVRAECPHCGASMTDVAALSEGEPLTSTFTDDYFDTDHGKAGGYDTTCESCGEGFVIPLALGKALQQAALKLIGEVL